MKDLHFELPPGLIGNPTPLPQCSEQRFTTENHTLANECPADAAVGVATVITTNPLSPSSGAECVHGPVVQSGALAGGAGAVRVLDRR